jgi:hypothetical protein
MGMNGALARRNRVHGLQLLMLPPHALPVWAGLQKSRSASLAHRTLFQSYGAMNRQCNAVNELMHAQYERMQAPGY